MIGVGDLVLGDTGPGERRAFGHVELVEQDGVWVTWESGGFTFHTLSDMRQIWLAEPMSEQDFQDSSDAEECCSYLKMISNHKDE